MGGTGPSSGPGEWPGLGWLQAALRSEDEVSSLQKRECRRCSGAAGHVSAVRRARPRPSRSPAGRQLLLDPWGLGLSCPGLVLGELGIRGETEAERRVEINRDRDTEKPLLLSWTQLSHLRTNFPRTRGSPTLVTPRASPRPPTVHSQGGLGGGGGMGARPVLPSSSSTPLRPAPRPAGCTG